MLWVDLCQVFGHLPVADFKYFLFLISMSVFSKKPLKTANIKSHPIILFLSVLFFPVSVSSLILFITLAPVLMCLYLLPSSSSTLSCFSVHKVTGKPFFIVSSFSHRWLFGWEGCRFYGWAGFFFGCGSLITMTVVSLDRYFKICHLRYGMMSHISCFSALLCIPQINFFKIWNLTANI